jgi:phosphate transport system substrate-binding protein
MQDRNPDEKNPSKSEQPDISEYIPGHDVKDMATAGTSGTSAPGGKPKSSKKELWKNALKVLVALLLAAGLFFAWFFSSIIIAFSTVHKHFYFTCWTVFLFGLLFVVCGFLFGAPKKLKRIFLGIFILPLVSAGAFRAWTWWTVDRFPVMVQEVDWRQYRPFEEGNKLVKVEIPAQYALYPDGGYPSLNGAYALYPIYAAMAQGMYPRDILEVRRQVWTDGSDVIYYELLKGERDLVFALAPSKKQAEEAEQAGVKYELTPFCMDAFVFYVNAKNPVDNLTTEQIKGIYSGKITDWKDVGAPFSTKIVPFQRNEGSGSQTTLQKLMGDTPIMPPLKEDRLGGMGEIINDTANYRNYRAALGFSFRYYSTEMLRNNQIKLLSIDGVAPTVENIRNGTYPLVATAYMVTARPRLNNVRKIVDFMLSPEGQRLVEETGYVSLGTVPAE